MSVALRKESVDRNKHLENRAQDLAKSLSARRAWIEIFKRLFGIHEEKVALRKESVDRNEEIMVTKEYCPLSLSARRAWIEILVAFKGFEIQASLSARRAWIEILPQ